MEQSVMEDIGRRFVRYSTKFPEEVIDLQEEIKIIQNEIESRFQEDIGNIKRILNNKRISININFPQFENNIYLIKQVLYTHTKIPDPEKCGDVIRFYTANLFICKDVLQILVRYVQEFVIEKLRRSYLDYEKRIIM